MEQRTPSGLIVETRATVHPPDEPTGLPPVRPTAWAGWPTDWATPNWYGQVQVLSDIAWACLDSNAAILSTMPPYLVGAAPSLSADWLTNPNPDLYSSWEEFAQQLVWDFQAAGEVFVIADAWYATGWPARFHVVPPWTVQAEIGPDGRRWYFIGALDVTRDILHIRYRSTTGDAHGHGPLEAGAPRLVAAEVLMRYATDLARGGGVPSAVLTHPGNLTAEGAALLQAQWVEARMASLALPAVVSGGVTYQPLSMNPKDMALVELAQHNEARIAVLLGVPPFCVALPSGGDPLTYSNVQMLFDYRWRSGLRPLAQRLMAALSQWALPRGTSVELNRDEWVRPDPKARADTWKVYIDAGVLTAEQVAQIERFALATAAGLTPNVPVEALEAA